MAEYCIVLVVSVLLSLIGAIAVKFLNKEEGVRIIWELGVLSVFVFNSFLLPEALFHLALMSYISIKVVFWCLFDFEIAEEEEDD